MSPPPFPPPQVLVLLLLTSPSLSDSSPVAHSQPDAEPHFHANGSWAHSDVAPSYFSGRAPSQDTNYLAPVLQQGFNQALLPQQQQQYLPLQQQYLPVQQQQYLLPQQQYLPPQQQNLQPQQQYQPMQQQQYIPQQQQPYLPGQVQVQLQDRVWQVAAVQPSNLRTMQGGQTYPTAPYSQPYNPYNTGVQPSYPTSRLVPVTTNMCINWLGAEVPCFV